MNNTDIRLYVFAALFAALTAAGAFIRVPLPPVPFTLQTLFVFVSAGFLGAKVGSLSQLIYLSVGLLGFPVFANGGGIGYIYTPTFGFLLSYPIVAYVVGWLSKKYTIEGNSSKEKILTYCWIYSIGTLLIFLVGIPFLMLNFKYVSGRAIDFNAIIWSTFIIFIPTAILKIISAAWITERLRRNFENSI